MLNKINIDSSVPVYEQIEYQIQFMIVSGNIKSGEQLPTVRDLAERLGVNPNTVAKSYRDLEVMGLVRGRRGRGYFIEKAALSKIRDVCIGRIAGRLHEVVSEAKAAAIAKKDISAIIGESFSADSGPYGEIPQKLKSILKKK